MWHAQGSHFTAKSDNGTPAQTKSIFSVPPWCAQHSSPQPTESDCGHQRGTNSFLSRFSLLIWSPNVRKRFGATFGSRRGAIVQQNPTTHLLRLEVLFSFRHGALNIVLIHSTRVGIAMRNIQFFSVFSPLVWSPNARKRLDATFDSSRGAILQHICESAHHPADFHSFGIIPTYVVAAQCPLLIQSSRNLAIQSNGIFPIALLSPPAREPRDATCGTLRGAILQPNWPSVHHHPDFI